MILIIVLNTVFAAFVLVGIVGLHLHAIAKDHSEHTASESVAIAPSSAVEARPQGMRTRDPVEAYGQVPAPARV